MKSNSSHLVFLFVGLVFTFAQLCYKQQVCLPDFSNISTPTLPQKPYKSPEIWAKSETPFYFSQPLLKEARSLWCTHTSLNISIKNVTFHSGVNDAQELSVKCVLKVQCVSWERNWKETNPRLPLRMQYNCSNSLSISQWRVRADRLSLESHALESTDGPVLYDCCGTGQTQTEPDGALDSTLPSNGFKHWRTWWAPGETVSRRWGINCIQFDKHWNNEGRWQNTVSQNSPTQWKKILLL